MSKRSHVVLGALCAIAALAFPAGAVHGQQAVELPLPDHYLESDFPEVYRIGDGIQEWELLSRVTSVSFDALGNLHIGDLAGDELSPVEIRQ